MKHTIIGIMITLAIMTSVATATNLTVQQIPPAESANSQSREKPQPPANTTIISGLKSIPFELSLSTDAISIAEGQCASINIMINSTEKANLKVMITSAQVLEPSLAKLPLGITAFFNYPEICIEANSSAIVQLTLSIDNEAVPSTYELKVFADQETSYGGMAVGVPLKLTIQ